MAHYRLEPFGGEQELLATLCALAWEYCSRGTDAKKFDAHIEQLKRTFMPPDWIGSERKQPSKPKSIDQLYAAADSVKKAIVGE